MMAPGQFACPRPASSTLYTSCHAEVEAVAGGGRPPSLHFRVSENRATRIGGLFRFFSVWGIQGVPLFWEMPVSQNRAQEGQPHQRESLQLHSVIPRKGLGSRV